MIETKQEKEYLEWHETVQFDYFGYVAQDSMQTAIKLKAAGWSYRKIGRLLDRHNMTIKNMCEGKDVRRKNRI